MRKFFSRYLGSERVLKHGERLAIGISFPLEKGQAVYGFLPVVAAAFKAGFEVAADFRKLIGFPGSTGECDWI